MIVKSRVEAPTAGRILHYTYGPDDRVESAARGAIRPAMIAHVERTEDGAVSCDVVVFTAGTRDFLPGRDGFTGTVSRRSVPVSEKPTPGALHWPVREQPSVQLAGA